MNEILEILGMSMLSQKFEDERMDFNVILSASDEDLMLLGVRTIGDRVRLRRACRQVYTRSSTSTHRASSNRPGREERALLFLSSLSSTGTGEGRTEGRVEPTVMVLVTLIEKEKLIIHELGNLCVCQIVMPEKCQHQRKNKCYTEGRFGA